MLKKIILALTFSTYVFAEVPNREIEEKLSGDYHYTLDLDRKMFDLTQNILAKDCKVRIQTYNEVGVIQEDNYDLTRYNIFKRVKGFKGTVVLAFGFKSILLERSVLHFNSKEQREPVYKLFKEYAKLCKKRGVRRYSRELNSSSEEENRNRATNFTGSIPEGETPNSGSVFTEEHNISLSLLRGEDSFIERYKALKNAKKSIYMEQLFIRGDEVGVLFSEAAIQKRMEGLDVRVLVTALFNVITNKDFKVDMKNSTVVLRNMMAAGIRVHGFGCKGFLKNEIRGVDLLKFIRPSHVKNLIIDGAFPELDSAISISGGLNVSSRYFLLGKKMQWLDQDIGAKGPILKEMNNAFLREFYDREIHYKTYEDDNTCLNPYDPIKQRKDYLNFKYKHTKTYIPAKKPNVIAEKEYISKNINLILNGKSKDGGPLKTTKWVKAIGARYVMARPDEGEDFLLKTHIDLVNSAKEEILIANVFGLFVPEMKNALRSAAARGVKIRILTNDPINDKGNPIVNILARHYYRDLVYGNHPHLDSQLDSSLNYSPEQFEINEWTGRLKGELTPPEIHIVMHSKFMVIDRNVGLVGSFNMDYASLYNLEQVLLFESPELAADLAGHFESDLLFSKRLTLDEIDSFKSSKGSRLFLLLGKILRSRL